MNKSPMRVSNNRGISGSPRNNSLNGTARDASMGGSMNGDYMTQIKTVGGVDPTLAKMRKSCERIAAVLGLKEGDISTYKPASFGGKRDSSDPGTKSPIQDYLPPQPMIFTNMNNPSGLGRE